MKKRSSPKNIRVDQDIWQKFINLKAKRTWNQYLRDLAELVEGKVVVPAREVVVPHPQSNKILDIFYEINKAVDYKKPFQRDAASWLIGKYGLELVEKVAKFAIQVRGMPYAPRISKPTELKEKWADLETFALTEKNKAQSKTILSV